MTRITLDGVAHSYIRRPRNEADYALRPLHHVWQQGMAYALLGPSGCGKTTLLNIISGLIIPSEGRLLFDDRDVTRLPTEQRNIAQVFQFPVIYDTMTVAENLAFPLRNRKLPKAAITARVAEIAAMLELTPDLNRRARGLTADAKQKISLGRGLVRSDVSAVLFDEPLTVIDPALKWELRSRLKAVHRALDLLMIYVTHDQTEALTFADRVVVMNEGQAVQIGTPKELFERPDHTFVGYFIGSPGMNLLPASIEGDRAYVGNSVVTLGAAYPTLRESANVQIGVRPDFVTLTPGNGLKVQVRRVDDFGRKRLAHVSLDGLPLVATVPDGMPAIGTEANIAFDPAHVLVYQNDIRVEGIASGIHVQGIANDIRVEGIANDIGVEGIASDIHVKGIAP
jgi:glycerol transport system ATP-binding protein